MRQYRIVSEPRLGIADSYYIQSKGCGLLSFIWWNHKAYSPYGSHTKCFWSQDEAEKALDDLRRYDMAETRIVKTITCDCEVK